MLSNSATTCELDLQRQLNLLSLSNTIGDKIILKSRKEDIYNNSGQSSLRQESIETIMAQSKPDQHVIYDPKNGPKHQNKSDQ